MGVGGVKYFLFWLLFCFGINNMAFVLFLQRRNIYYVLNVLQFKSKQKLLDAIHFLGQEVNIWAAAPTSIKLPWFCSGINKIFFVFLQYQQQLVKQGEVA